LLPNSQVNSEVPRPGRVGLGGDGEDKGGVARPDKVTDLLTYRPYWYRQMPAQDPRHSRVPGASHSLQESQ
jgi:hypothetical protein